MTDDALTFDSIGARYLNCGAGTLTSGAGVLGRGLVEGVWYVLLAKNTSFGWSILGKTGIGRFFGVFPNTISFFLACNTSMYLPNSASSGFSSSPSNPSTSSPLLIDARWAKGFEFS